jgi:hypothetical protein
MRRGQPGDVVSVRVVPSPQIAGNSLANITCGDIASTLLLTLALYLPRLEVAHSVHA